MITKCKFVTNESDFQQILQSQTKIVALIYATWCPFCIRFLPVFERSAEGQAHFFLMVQDNEEIIADKYSIEVIPTVLYFEDSKLSKRLDAILGVGLSEKQLTHFIHTIDLA